MSNEFTKYIESHRANVIALTEAQERELARLYIEAAAEIKLRAKDIISQKTLTAAQAKIRINSLLREASRLSNNFEGILDRSLIASADLGQEINKIALSMYQQSLKNEGVSVNFGRILNKVSKEAVTYTYNKIWNDGLKLSDRIWLLDRRTKQEIERIIMQNIISGGAASDKLTISALENLLNPTYTPAKLTALHGRKVGYEASRLLRTETSIALNEGDRLSALKNPGSKGQRFLIAIGACEICTPLDGLPVEKSGYPPIHPNCRCTTIDVSESVESFTIRYLQFMDNPASQPDLARWFKEVYKKAA